MADWKPDDPRRRRRRLWKGLLIGAAAIGVPAVANALVRRQAGRLQPPTWGRSHRYDWDAGEIAFLRLGERAAGDRGRRQPPLVLLHSFGPGHDSREWERAAQELARGRVAFVPDLLGWGRSARPRIDYDAELHLRFLTDFLTEVVREPAVLVGVGLSAAYAVQLAADHPELVHVVAAVVPQGIGLHDEEPRFGDQALYGALRVPVFGTSVLNLMTSRPALGHYLRREVYAAPERVDAAVIDNYWRSAHQRGAEAPLASFLAGHLDIDVEPALGRLTRPLWLGWGRQATAPPVALADLWLHHQPGAELDVFEEAGNLPHAEVPTYFALRLARFLDQIPSS
jgi:pimeloyl-ACP methyl ester carboxylesterase